MNDKFQPRLSVVIVLNDGVSFDALLAFDSLLNAQVQRLDYVLVANGLDEANSVTIMRRIHELPDATVYFLPDPVDPDFARLIGIDNATGDWILCTDELELPQDMLTQLLAQNDGVAEHITLNSPSEGSGRSPLYRALSNFYVKVYRGLTGLEIDRGKSGTKLYSRGAAQYILHNRCAEMLLHSMSIGNFFPSKIIRDERPVVQHKHRTTRQGFIKGWRILMRSTTFPLRFVTTVAIGSCIFNAIYAVAVVLIHMFKSDVAPGWATLSMQLSLMFFIVSLLLALIGEYLIQIDRGVNHRLRYIITRDIRSSRSRIDGLRNVVNVASNS